MLYARRFGGPNAETVTDLSMHPSGNLYLTGTFTGIADFDPSSAVVNLGSGAGAADGYVMNLSPTGGLVYARPLGGGASTTQPAGIFADAGGNMYVTGGFSGKADFEPANAVYAVNGGTGSGFVAKLMPAVGASKGPKNLPPTNVTAGGLMCSRREWVGRQGHRDRSRSAAAHLHLGFKRRRNLWRRDRKQSRADAIADGGPGMGDGTSLAADDQGSCPRRRQFRRRSRGDDDDSGRRANGEAGRTDLRCGGSPTDHLVHRAQRSIFQGREGGHEGKLGLQRRRCLGSRRRV